MKYGFLFGAGAEVGYGLPSGGKFALEIFRYDAAASKEQFKQMRDGISNITVYASDWLPMGYREKNISSFGKSVFENIIRDTIEHNRDAIIRKLNHFNEFAKKEAEWLNKNEKADVEKVLESLLGLKLKNITMKQEISFIREFEDGNGLFSSNYFSALLLVYKNKALMSAEKRMELGKILTAILQLQVGALSENLTRKINDSLFAKKDDEIDLFDDLGEIIQLNYQSGGLAGMEYLLEKRKSDVDTDEGIVLRFAQCIIEAIYSSVLDYKSLIDTNWHYLYCPKSEWAKFCKISIFLMNVREYILEQAKHIDTGKTDGYYHQLKNELDAGRILASAIATTNYNQFIHDVLQRDIVFLNGSTKLWYDPYINRIGSKDELEKAERHFIVPLMFTQSGTKPMTSIEMSVRYVRTYEKWKASDAIVAVGFGFNADDEHINGIIRTLIDCDGKKLLVVTLGSGKSSEEMAEELGNRLKVTNTDRIKVIQVDKKGVELSSGKLWTESIQMPI